MWERVRLTFVLSAESPEVAKGEKSNLRNQKALKIGEVHLTEGWENCTRGQKWPRVEITESRSIGKVVLGYRRAGRLARRFEYQGHAAPHVFRLHEGLQSEKR